MKKAITKKDTKELFEAIEAYVDHRIKNLDEDEKKYGTYSEITGHEIVDGWLDKGCEVQNALLNLVDKCIESNGVKIIE